MMNYVFIFEQIVQTCKIINVAAQVNLIIKKDFFVSYTLCIIVWCKSRYLTILNFLLF